MMKREEINDLLVGEHLRGLVFSWVAAEEVEEPYRSLLCHDHDMTSGLANFHEGEVTLEVLSEKRGDQCYQREVLLRVGEKAVEYGVIQIALERLSGKMSSQILAGERPLGALLIESGLRFVSRPDGFLKVAGADFQPDFFPSSDGNFLFGRYNRLIDERGAVLARIIEILPRETP